MKTHPLLTDLTPEQEEKVSGGVASFWIGYWVICGAVGAAKGALEAWKNR